MRASFFLLLALSLLAGAVDPARAQDAPAPFTLDLPDDGHSAIPPWLGHATQPGGAFAMLDLPVTPPNPALAMLVTVFFEEKNGGFLRIAWQASPPVPESASGLPGPGEAAQSVLLSNNFYEGIGMKNQRSLLVPADVMKKGGGLVFTASDTTLGISRIRIEWLQNSTGLSSPSITDQSVTLADRTTTFASDLAGSPASPRDAAWHDRVVDVPLTDSPTRIEQGVDFPVRMDKVPKRARLEFKEAGLASGQHLVVWLNDQRVGTVAPSVPDLSDAGYPSGADDTYVGWRNGSLLIPSGKLTAGENTFQFSSEADDASPAAAATPKSVAPLALKNVALELDYPAAPAPAPAPPASLASDIDRLNPAVNPPRLLLKLPDPSAAAPTIP